MLQKPGVNTMCQTLREVVRFGQVVADDLTPHVWSEAMLAGTFYLSWLAIMS